MGIKLTPNLDITPDIKVSVKQTFGIESNGSRGSQKGDMFKIDKNYKFDRDTT